nr:LysR family transcriptional regulator [Stutzerimonas kunmingensis]
MDMLQAMRVFVRVVDAGSFTAAAKLADTSTAQVSRLVAELENHLHARLLNRTTRRLALTEVGARFLERSREILTAGPGTGGSLRGPSDPARAPARAVDDGAGHPGAGGAGWKIR